MTSTGLIASASTLKNITMLINRYFYSRGELTPVMIDNGKWWVKNTEKNYFLPNYKLERKGGRYRFSIEQGLDPNKIKEKTEQIEMFPEPKETQQQLTLFSMEV